MKNSNKYSIPKYYQVPKKLFIKMLRFVHLFHFKSSNGKVSFYITDNEDYESTRITKQDYHFLKSIIAVKLDEISNVKLNN